MYRNYLVILLLLVGLYTTPVYSQAVLEIVQEPICWAAPSGADSSLTRYVLLSSRTPTSATTLAYTNASGTIVVPSGGTFTPGWCGCCGDGSGTADNDWYFVNANSISAPVWRSGRVLIGTPDDLPADTSHQLQLEGDWQFLPDAFGTRFDWQDTADTTGTTWYGILLSGPSGLGGSSNLSGGRNTFTVGTSNTVIDRTRLGVFAFAGNNPNDTDHALSAFLEATAEGNWSATNLGASVNLWTTAPNETFPRNTFTFQGDGRLELDRYFLFSDGVPTALLGYDNTTRDVTRHPIAGTASPGNTIVVNGTGTGLEWGLNGSANGDILQTVFVAKTNYIGGEKYYISKPILNLWQAKDSLNVGESLILYPGTYTYTGPYSSNPITGGFSLAKTDITDFFINGNATISATGGSSTFYPLFSDVTANYLTAETRRFKLFGPNATVSAVRGSQTICIPIGFYGLNSEVDVTLANVFSTGGRSWGVQVGCKRANINVENINISGNIGFGISIGLTNSGVHNTYQTRNIEANIGTITTQNTGDFRGQLRVQNVGTGTDSASIYKVRVKELINTTVASVYFSILSCNFRHGLIDYHINKITDFTSGNPNYSLFSIGTQDNALLDTLFNSVIKVRIDRVVTGNSPFSARPEPGFAVYGLWSDSTRIEYSLGDAKFTSASSTYQISNIFMMRGGSLNFHCDNCIKTANGTLFSVLNSNSFSATSRINISGSYRLKGASPVISIAQSAPIYLRNCYLYNDGGVLINATVPVTIVIDGDTNVRPSDVNSNVTLIYLPGANLSFSGTGPAYNLNVVTGTSVTFTPGTGIVFSATPTDLTISEATYTTDTVALTGGWVNVAGLELTARKQSSRVTMQGVIRGVNIPFPGLVNVTTTLPTDYRLTLGGFSAMCVDNGTLRPVLIQMITGTITVQSGDGASINLNDDPSDALIFQNTYYKN